jgi:acetyl/propionyl-CoA carboxylase alpha subunit
VFGVGTNHGFLRDITHPKFLAGELTTRFIEEAFPCGWTSADQSKVLPIAAAAVWAAGLETRQASPALGPFVSLGGFRVLGRAGRPARVTVAVEHGGTKHTVLLSGGAGTYDATLDGATHAVTVTLRDRSAQIAVDGVARRFAVVVESDTVGLSADGISITYRVAAAIDGVGGGAGESAGGGSRVVATMPGLINAVDVKVGQEVELGQPVVVLEAMKLMIQLVAPVAGKVKEVFCAPGQTVPVGTVLVEIEPAQN